MTFASIILALITLQRLGELLLARANTRLLLARGATEVGAGHYPWMVAIHAGWLAALWLEGWRQPVNLLGLGVFVLLQVLRVWIVLTLGARWTTRLIVLRDAPLVTGGPYRLFAHPNYLVVALEIAVLPLTLGLWDIAAGFSVLNAMILAVRIRAEDTALSTIPAA
ncbi:MAG: hypothetical protein EKK40_15970 [Bradyrhizobiaceae bacterium]|nr:MAG: hypothetical protein EKK40_15970 [Bradyrhizobiaceae bacterium]